MNEMKEIYQALKKAIEEDEWEEVMSINEKKDATVRSKAFEKEEWQTLVEWEKEMMKLIEQKKKTVHDFLVNQTKADAVAKKYGQD